jgi:dihydrofolate reductase
MLRSKGEVLSLSRYLKCDVYVIGGAITYSNFSEDFDKWIVTDVPETVDDADVFMPQTFLQGFAETGRMKLEGDLEVRSYGRN